MQIKGPRTLPSQQQWGVGSKPQMLSSEVEKRGWGGAGPTQFLVKGSCASPQKLGQAQFWGEKYVGEEDGHMITKAWGGQKSRSQQAPVNQISKSKSPRRRNKGSLGKSGFRGELGPWGTAPAQGMSPVHDAVTVQSHEVNLAAAPRTD